jgi:hypothetical protein
MRSGRVRRRMAATFTRPMVYTFDEHPAHLVGWPGGISPPGSHFGHFGSCSARPSCLACRRSGTSETGQPTIRLACHRDPADQEYGSDIPTTTLRGGVNGSRPWAVSMLSRISTSPCSQSNLTVSCS